MILDSPFNKLSTIVEEYTDKNMSVPGFILSMGMKLMGNAIEKKVGFDLFDLRPGEAAEKINIPALFICGKNDKLLPPKTVIDIYKKYKSKKKV